MKGSHVLILVLSLTTIGLLIQAKRRTIQLNTCRNDLNNMIGMINAYVANTPAAAAALIVDVKSQDLASTPVL
jgi:hypothetical protein